MTFRCYVALEDSDDEAGGALNPFSDPAEGTFGDPDRERERDLHHEHDFEVVASTAPGKKVGGRQIYGRRKDKEENKKRTELLKAVQDKQLLYGVEADGD